MNGIAGAVLAAALATSAPVPTPWQTTPVEGLTVNDVVAKSRAASGGGKVVKNETGVWSVRENGLTGTARRVTRGRDWAETDEIGPFTIARGYAAGRYWHQNENGEVLLSYLGRVWDDRQPLSSETLARVQAPLDAYVVAGVARDGTARRRYYDAHTFLLVRSEVDAYGKHAYAAFEDFVTDAAGRTWARHRYGGDQFPGDDWDERLVSDDLTSPVAEAAVVLPQNRRTLVEFPAAKTTVRLPARFLHGMIVVRVAIAGRGLDFILDSGASSLVLDSAVASELGLTLEGHETELIAGAVDIKRTKIAEMTIGELKMHDVVVSAFPFSPQIDTQTKIAGLLGFDFLDDASVKIDYVKETVDATAPGAFVPDAASTDIPVRLDSGVPEVSLRIGTTTGDRFVLDTGAQHDTIVLFAPYVQQNESGVSDSAKKGQGSGSTRIAVGGEVQRSRVLLSDLTFGPWHIYSTYGALAHPLAGDALDGLIGSDMLDNFTVTLDEPHGKVYLKPTEPLPLASPPASPPPPSAGAPLH